MAECSGATRAFPTSISLELTSLEQQEPLLRQFDPYHQTSFYVQHPFANHLVTEQEYKSFGNTTTTFPVTNSVTNPNSTTKNSLNYQDFSPDLEGLCNNSLRCEQHFSDLLVKANRWLRQNPQVRVQSCETICWWTSEAMGVGDTEAVVFQQGRAPDEDTIYLFGLRLWLVPANPLEEDDDVQHLGYRDFQPVDREGLNHLMTRVNYDLQRYPIPGQILAAETVFSPMLSPEHPQPTTLLWRDSQSPLGQYNIFLRLFYVEGSTNDEQLGMKDFCPDLVDGKHEAFGALVKKSTRWLSQEQCTRVINLRSLYVSKENDCAADNCADRVTQHSYSFRSHQYFQILRLFYAKRPYSHSISKANNINSINYVTFTPVPLLPGPPTSVDFERARQTIMRVTAWLNAAGAEVLSAESLTTPVVPSMTATGLAEVSFWSPSIASPDSQHNKCLMHIRVYLKGEYKEPDPRLLPPLPFSLTSGLQMEYMQREERRYYAKKQKRRRRKSILILVCIALMAGALAIILLDQIGFIGM